MPNWKIHLEIGKQLNKTLNYSKKDLELFLLGNILPDINNGYMIKTVSKKFSHGHTHFQREGDRTYIIFFKNYGKEIFTNPLLLGYFSHLYTDYYWNENFNNKAKKIPSLSNLNKTELRILKQQDFRVYNHKFMQNTLEIKNIKKVIEQTRIVDRIFLQEPDLKQVIEFLHIQKENDDSLSYYTEKELDSLLEETITNILNFKNSF